MTPINPIDAPTMNLAKRKRYQFKTNVNREPKMPKQHAIKKVRARPPPMSFAPAPDPKIVPIAGNVFIKASLRYA